MSESKLNKVAQFYRKRAKAQAEGQDLEELSKSSDFYSGKAREGGEHAEIGSGVEFAEETQKRLMKKLPVGSKKPKAKAAETYSATEDGEMAEEHVSDPWKRK